MTGKVGILDIYNIKGLFCVKVEVGELVKEITDEEEGVFLEIYEASIDITDMEFYYFKSTIRHKLKHFWNVLNTLLKHGYAKVESFQASNNYSVRINEITFVKSKYYFDYIIKAVKFFIELDFEIKGILVPKNKSGPLLIDLGVPEYEEDENKRIVFAIAPRE